MTPYPVRLVEASKLTDRLAYVDVSGAEPVRVQWRLGRSDPWRCSTCGPMRRTECLHTFSVAVRLAEELLGLTVAPEYRTNREEVPA